MKRSVLFVAAVTLTLGVVGCGSDSGGPGNGGSSGFDDTSNPELAPVKVGMIAPIGTANSDLADMPAGLAAGIGALNARGGLNGHHVDMVFCNDKDDPNQGARCARQMVEEKVVAVAGLAGGSAVQDKVQPILEKAGIPIVGVNSSSPVVWNAKNAYLIAPAALLNYQALIGYAVKHDLLPMAVAAADNPAGLQFADFLEATLKELNGGEGFAEVVPVADNTADYAPIAGSLVESGAKSVLNIVGTQQQLGVGRALDGQGSDAVLLTASPLSVEQLSGAGRAAGLIVTAGGYPPFDHPSMEQFRNEMTTEEAAGNEDASLETASPYAAYGWVAVQALEQVTKELDTITAQTVSKALDKAGDIDLGGIVPPWTPTKMGPEHMSRVSNTATWFAGFADGKTVALVDAAVSQQDLTARNFEAQLPQRAR